MNFSLTSYLKDEVTEELYKECSDLFSNHYGVWSDRGPFPNQRIKLSAQRLKDQYFRHEKSFVVVARNRDSQKLIGHAIGVKCYSKSGKGSISWITQLVVDKNYRGRGVGTRLCTLAWDAKDCYACGLATSHPYAILALERACCLPVDIEKTIEHGDSILQLTGIPYLMNAKTFFKEGRVVANTNFYVSHDEVELILSRMGDWKLGELNEGEEFIAICFPVNTGCRRSSASLIEHRHTLRVVGVAVGIFLFSLLK